MSDNNDNWCPCGGFFCDGSVHMDRGQVEVVLLYFEHRSRTRREGTAAGHAEVSRRASRSTAERRSKWARPNSAMSALRAGSFFAPSPTGSDEAAEVAREYMETEDRAGPPTTDDGENGVVPYC